MDESCEEIEGIGMDPLLRQYRRMIWNLRILRNASADIQRAHLQLILKQIIQFSAGFYVDVGVQVSHLYRTLGIRITKP